MAARRPTRPALRAAVLAAVLTLTAPATAWAAEPRGGDSRPHGASSAGADAGAEAESRPASLTLRARLLDADQLPALVSGARWRELRTSPAEAERLAAACHRYPMVTVGADRVVRRDFGPHDDSTSRAGELVVRFADTTTAWRVHEVLRAWQQRCAQHLGDGARVGALHDVELDRGHGQWYVVRPHTATRDEGAEPSTAVREVTALVRVGARLSVLRLEIPAGDDRIRSGDVEATMRVVADRLA